MNKNFLFELNCFWINYSSLFPCLFCLFFFLWKYLYFVHINLVKHISILFNSWVVRTYARLYDEYFLFEFSWRSNIFTKNFFYFWFHSSTYIILYITKWLNNPQLCQEAILVGVPFPVFPLILVILRLLQNLFQNEDHKYSW